MITSRNRPWPQIDSAIRQKYNIVGEIDLLEVDRSPSMMYYQLKRLYREEYQPNDRILIYHYDTDFYLENIGFTLYNLLLCLDKLDIPLCFCLMLTSHYGISAEIDKISKRFRQRDVADKMSVFESNYDLLSSIPVVGNNDVDAGMIDSHFICLQGKSRTHRLLFSCGLKALDLLDKGIVSWHFNSDIFAGDSRDEVIHQPMDPKANYLDFLLTFPWPSRINDSFSLNGKLNAWHNDHYHFFNHDFKDPRIDGDPNEKNFTAGFIKKAFLYISSETVLHYPYPYLTEKTFKALLYKRPFVILGPKNSLNQLRTLGFKTFGDFWDESYDKIEDPATRLIKVMDIVADICSKDIDNLRTMCYSMQDILDYNLNHYIEHYSSADLKEKLKTI